MLIVDKVTSLDALSNSKKQYKTKVTFINPDTGDVLFETQNLVLLSGREFILRKLFGLPYEDDLTGDAVKDLERLNRRLICAYGVGRGGTSLAQPRVPLSPSPADTDLSNPAIFNALTLNKEELDKQYAIYAEMVAVKNNIYHACKKRIINAKPVINLDANDDEIFMQMDLTITKEECVNDMINEIVLYTGEQSENLNGIPRFIKFKPFSRVTFSTEYFDEAKTLLIDYRVYF
jgi:hypothetical protein